MQPTALLHSGEQFDSDLQQYYLRARYYDPSNGRFNRIDPFGGNYSDPQSLHKYAYGQEDPINAVDPTGAETLVEIESVEVIGLDIELSVAQVGGAVAKAVLSGIGWVVYKTAAALILGFIAVTYAAAVVSIARDVKRKEPRDIVYRRLHPNEVGTFRIQGIKSTDPFALTTPEEHILGVKPSSFISTSRDFAVPLYRFNNNPTPIVAINLFKVPYGWIDFTQPANVATYLTKQDAIDLASENSEVSVRIHIPPNAIEAVFQGD